MEESSESRDRLSELPESLILHILSYLPMKNVVRPTLLSKRWKYLWTTIPCLNFVDYTVFEDIAKTRNFVNRALMFWKGTKTLKFNICFDLDSEKSLFGDTDLWVLFAKENNVEELCIHLMYDPDASDYPEGDGVMANSKEDVYWTPLCLNSCSSIRKLSLVFCNLQIDRSPHWDQLKSLEITGFCFSEHAIDKILSGAPQLEVFKLDLMESYENLNIRSGSLKQLMIHKSYEDRASKVTTLGIWCPNLGTLNISGAPFSKCLLTNVSSLTDATLDLFRPRCPFAGEELLGEMLRQILPTIQHVEKVTLSGCCTRLLGAMGKKCLLSPLLNAKFLKLNAISIELDQMVDLLRISPKLKMLVLDGLGYGLKIDAESYLESETNLPKSFLQQLRTVEITLSLLETSIFPSVEFLLKHASMLEKMVIRLERITSLPWESLFLAAEKLLSMPRSSPTAKVIMCKK